ncbi:MAG: hypothetical protein IJ456_00050 [Bacteroides sp.]|nr:hypothetical protein [Bacteroides sp.]
MKKTVFLILSAILCIVGNAQDNPIKVACLGNSITEGSGVENRIRDSYPGVLGTLLGDKYEVRNFGISGHTLMFRSDRPLMRTALFQRAVEWQPDVIVVKLGTNDSKRQNARYIATDFKRDLCTLIDMFGQQANRPQVYLCTPVPATAIRHNINEIIIVNEIIPVIKEVAEERKLHLIDLYEAMKPYPQHFPDNIHPNTEGAALMGRYICQTITGKEAPDYECPPYTGKKSEWKGYDRYDFIYWGKPVTVIAPSRLQEKDNTWVWYSSSFDKEDPLKEKMLEKGCFLIGYDLSDSYGNAEGTQDFKKLLDMLRKVYGLGKKGTIAGRTFSALAVLNFASKHPDYVQSIYLDTPVCNLNSLTLPTDVKEAVKKAHALWEYPAKFANNPCGKFDYLIKYHIPITVCHDESISNIPYQEHFGKMEERLEAEGYAPTVIHK